MPMPMPDNRINVKQQAASRRVTEDLEHRKQVHEAKEAQNPADQGRARVGPVGWLVLLFVLALIVAVVVFAIAHP